MIVGVVGTIGAGKGTVADYLSEKGFDTFSLSDAIRNEATKRGLPHDRRTLQDLGNELRKEHGPDILMRIALQQVQGDCTIESIRNPHEANLLKKQSNAILVGVDASPAIRFNRVLNREELTGREADAKTYEEFLALEQRELSSDMHSQQLHTVLGMTDHMVRNDFDTKEELLDHLDKRLLPLLPQENDLMPAREA